MGISFLIYAAFHLLLTSVPKSIYSWESPFWNQTSGCHRVKYHFILPRTILWVLREKVCSAAPKLESWNWPHWPYNCLGGKRSCQTVRQLGYFMCENGSFGIKSLGIVVTNNIRVKAAVCLCVTVRSRSLLFYNEGAPLEESLVTSEGERLQSEAHSHVQTSHYTADAHRNHTTGPELDRR